MERIKKTLWPADSMMVSPEQILRRQFGFPVALIKSLYPILGKEKVIKLIKGAVEEELRNSASSPYYYGPQIRSFADFLEWSKGLQASILTGPLDMGRELVQRTTVGDMDSMKITDKEISFRVIKCLWADILKEMDATEIGKEWICMSDFPRAKVWSSKLDLKRTQTIMEGAPYCDFCFTWNE